MTTKAKGGVGKNLSDGWNLNFAVGCSHACPFCYCDSIIKRFHAARLGEAAYQPWGSYLFIPKNLEEAIEKTPWHRWRGKEVMMSSMHDPYLPTLAPWGRVILDRALPAGVRFCIQTRSPLVQRDFDLLTKFRRQVRLQVSIATADRMFARAIEPRVAPPERRLEVLRKASEAGINTGVILAPIFPEVPHRPDLEADLDQLARALSTIGPDHIYGESLHIRGENVRLVENALGYSIPPRDGFDRTAARCFRRSLRRHGLYGVWWPEG